MKTIWNSRFPLAMAALHAVSAIVLPTDCMRTLLVSAGIWLVVAGVVMLAERRANDRH